MEQQVKILKALSHQVRLEIVKMLIDKESLCVCDIQETFESGQSNISQHLKILKESDILDSKKEGGWVYYKLKNKKIIDILRILEEI